MKRQSDFQRYKGVIEDLGYGSRIGEEIPATTTYREAVVELTHYIGMANERGEPFNVEVFGDGYDAPVPSVRRAYFRARRLLKKFSAVPNPDSRLN